MVMSKGLRLVSGVAHMEELRIADRTLARKPEGDRPPLKF
jgi:hypothetical protein